MQRTSKEYTVWNSVTPQAITSSTDASPVVVTKASHGYVTGDRIIIFGHTTNVAINGIWEVVKIDADTFSLKDINTGTAVAGSGGGAGSGGVMALAPAIISCEEFRNASVTFVSTGTATLTVKVAGSLGKIAADASSHGDTPNFGATLTDTNPYQFVQIVDLDTASAINGATGIAVAGTDFNKMYEVNVNGLKYFTFIPTAWTQGAITIKVKLFNNL